MISYTLTQNKGKKSVCFGKWYAHATSIGDMVDLEALAEHMEQHNSGFSKAMCLGVMTAMVNCIKEMVLDGKRVKIDNLAIFWAGLHQKVGAQSDEDFDPQEYIDFIRLRTRATGILSRANLNTKITLKRVNVVPRKKKGTTTDTSSTNTSSTTDDSQSTAGGE